MKKITVIERIDKFIDCFTKVKGRPPEEIAIDKKTFEDLKKLTKQQSHLYEQLQGGSYKGVKLKKTWEGR